MLRARFMVGVRLDDPAFPNTLGGFRDPSNTRRQLRDARGADALARVTSPNFRKALATVLDDAGHSGRQRRSHRPLANLDDSRCLPGPLDR